MAGSSYSIVGRRAGSSRTAYKHHPTNSVGEPALFTSRTGRTNNPYCLACGWDRQPRSCCAARTATDARRSWPRSTGGASSSSRRGAMATRAACQRAWLTAGAAAARCAGPGPPEMRPSGHVELFRMMLRPQVAEINGQDGCVEPRRDGPAASLLDAVCSTPRPMDDRAGDPIGVRRDVRELPSLSKLTLEVLARRLVFFAKGPMCRISVKLCIPAFWHGPELGLLART